MLTNLWKPRSYFQNAFITRSPNECRYLYDFLWANYLALAKPLNLFFLLHTHSDLFISLFATILPNIYGCTIKKKTISYILNIETFVLVCISERKKYLPETYFMKGSICLMWQTKGTLYDFFFFREIGRWLKIIFLWGVWIFLMDGKPKDIFPNSSLNYIHLTLLDKKIIAL